MGNGVETTICFFRDLYKTLQALPDEEAGILMKALFAHANGEEPDLRTPMAKVLYIGIADQMDRLDEYRRKKTRGAGSKAEQKGANGSKTEQTAAPYPYPTPYPYPVIKNGGKKDERGIDYDAAAREMFVKEVAK